MIYVPLYKLLLIAGVLVCSVSAKSQSMGAKLRGPGGQLEAAGAIAATFQVTMSILEGCSRSSKYRDRATKIHREYIARNKPVFMSVMQRLPALAQKSGGDLEVQRVQRELELGLGQIENAGRGAADAAAQRPNACPEFFARVAHGELDLKKSNSTHLRQLGL